MVIDHDLGHGGFTVSPARVGLGVDHDDRRLRGDGHGLDRNERDRDQVDHRPVFGAGDHAVDREGDGLAGLCRFQQRLDPQHARERVRVGIHVRNQNDAMEGQKRRQQLLARAAAGSLGVGCRFRAVEIGRHCRLGHRASRSTARATWSQTVQTVRSDVLLSLREAPVGLPGLAGGSVALLAG